MVLIFDLNGDFHLASKKLNKFYEDNNDFIVTEIDDFDIEYPYNYVDGKVIKGDKIVLSDIEIKEIEDDLIKTAHIQPRKLAYPSIEEQLDKLFHDIDNDLLNKTGSFYTSIKSIKDNNPKK